jgi:hypothetical protein
LSGPATQRIPKRAYAEFGDSKFTRLAEILVAHLPFWLPVSYSINLERRPRSKLASLA